MGSRCDITVVIQVPIEGLIEGARAGSPESLGLALEVCRPYLLRIAACVPALDPALCSKGDVADLVQETFLEASRDFSQFSGRTAAEWRAWLRRIFLNNLQHLVRHYRGTAKRQVDQEVSLDQLEIAGFPLGGVTVDDSLTPSELAMKREQEELVTLALAQLPERDRQVLVMRYQEKHTFEGIGRHLGCSTAAAHKACRRAIEHLRLELDFSSIAR